MHGVPPQSSVIMHCIHMCSRVGVSEMLALIYTLQLIKDAMRNYYPSVTIRFIIIIMIELQPLVVPKMRYVFYENTL